MSDEAAPSDCPQYGANIGATLPDGNNATHSIGLSPLFFNQAGWSFPWLERANATDGRGESENLWSRVVSKIESIHIISITNKIILPSRRDGSGAYAFSLRCLVSTTNSLIIKRNLVSDDTANTGVTLPDGVEATHNIGFSPFFMARIGHMPDSWRAISERGKVGIFWTPTRHISGLTQRFTFRSQDIWPSDINQRTSAQSLRCLVSTTNS